MNTMTNLCAQHAYVKSALIRNMLKYLLKIQVTFEKKKKYLKVLLDEALDKWFCKSASMILKHF